jgi:uncharacterized membrane protein
VIVQQPTPPRSLHAEGSLAGPSHERKKARWLAAAFVLYGLTATGLLATNVPPFQVADEPAHFLRAAQVAQGGLIGVRHSVIAADGSTRVTAGGRVDPALDKAAAPFTALPFHRERRVTQAYWDPNIHWSNTRDWQSFGVTANYPPLFYVPSAIGVLAGQHAGMSVLQTLVLSRLLTGAAAVALGAVGIAVAGGAAAWIFTILTLPMSLSLIASASQDALIIGCSALAGGLLLAALRAPAPSNMRLLAGLTVTLALAAAARPPYAVLAVLPLALKGVRLRLRIVAAAAIIACTAIWSIIAAVTTMTKFANADPMAQLAHLGAHPLLGVNAVWAALRRDWFDHIKQFIGVLGWLDTPLRDDYYALAAGMIGIAAVATMLRMKGEGMSGAGRFAVAAGLLLSVAVMFVIQYLVWTVPGAAIVEGMQGRYLLPLALAGAALLPALGDKRLPRLQNALLIVLAGFPVISLVATMRAVVLRYYLG